MKLVFKIAIVCCCLISCSGPKELEQAFSCNKNKVTPLKTYTDVKKGFGIQIPYHWKTNLFYNQQQSSIYAADTTKQLTETVLIDITQVQTAYNFTADFKKKLAVNDAAHQLQTPIENFTSFQNKKAYYRVSKGLKRNFSYQILNVFIQQDSTKALHLKAEVYGDVQVQERLCKAIHSFNTITIHESR